jgi:hypothetical protein
MIIFEVIYSVYLDKRDENNTENNNILLTVMHMTFWMLFILIYTYNSFLIPIK